MKTGLLRTLAVTVLLSSATSGCVFYRLEELRHVTPQGSAFQNSLALQYMEFSAAEEKEYDWLDSGYFADKGLMAAYGKTTSPEDLKEWNIPAAHLAELQEARTLLISMLSSPAIEQQPEMAARAQVSFDCWVEQQEEGWQLDDIAHCRDGFREAMEALSQPVTPEKPAAKPVAKKPAPKPVAKAVPAPEPKPVVEPMAEEPATVPVVIAEPQADEPEESAKPMRKLMSKEAYVVFFEKGDVGLTVSGKRVIDEVVQTLEPYSTYDVVLNSHTDTQGDAKDNLELTEKRAQMVKQRLVEGGVREGAIKIFAFGESDTPVKTGDNVDEPANRRVEIFLSE